MRCRYAWFLNEICTGLSIHGVGTGRTPERWTAVVQKPSVHRPMTLLERLTMCWWGSKTGLGPQPPAPKTSAEGPRNLCGAITHVVSLAVIHLYLDTKLTHLSTIL